MSQESEELKKLFSYNPGTSLSKAIVFAALDINRPSEMLPIKDYRENRFSELWRETFSKSSDNWTPQFRTELNQGDNRLAHRLFEGGEGYYRLRDLSTLSLSDANILRDIKKEYQQIMNLDVEELQDAELVFSISETEDDGVSFVYKGQKKSKKQTVSSDGREYYPRDRETAINALKHAEFRCEIDSTHKLFIKKDGRTTYTEPHHLVPLSAYKDFDVSLDVEENIVSLCSHCHNEIHYGINGKKLVEQLYKMRKEELAKVGISISLEKLLKYY